MPSDYKEDMMANSVEMKRPPNRRPPTAVSMSARKVPADPMKGCGSGSRKRPMSCMNSARGETDRRLGIASRRKPSRWGEIHEARE